jgi:DNA-binding HxlR family transcriptional regulator
VTADRHAVRRVDRKRLGKERMMRVAGKGSRSAGPIPDEGERLFLQLGARWTLHILLVLKSGEKRFMEIQRAIPRITPKILTLRLRELEAARFVRRLALSAEAEVHAYELGEAGIRLRPVLDAIIGWKARIRDAGPELRTPFPERTDVGFDRDSIHASPDSPFRL